MQTGFNERPITVFVRPSDSLFKQHRLPQIRVPIVAVEDRRIQPGTRDRGDECNIGGSRLQTGKYVAQRLPQRFNLTRMYGVVDGNPRGGHVIPLAYSHEIVQRRCESGDDGRRRTVLRGNGNRLTPWFDEGVNPFKGPRDRYDATCSRDCPDRLAT